MSEPTPTPGARTTALRRRRRRRLGVVLVAALLTAAGVYVGVQAGPPGRTRSPTASPSPSPTPVRNLDLSDLPISRAPFCGKLDTGDVAAALGGPVSATSHYDSGQRAALAPGVRDVSNEYDCTFSAGNGARARAWVFAAPVTPRAARAIAASARSQQGCVPVRTAPQFGTPSVGTMCRMEKPTGQSVTLRGLFGDSWLSCELIAPGRSGGAAATVRAEQLCVRVATTLGARP